MLLFLENIGISEIRNYNECNLMLRIIENVWELKKKRGNVNKLKLLQKQIKELDLLRLS